MTDCHQLAARVNAHPSTSHLVCNDGFVCNIERRIALFETRQAGMRPCELRAPAFTHLAPRVCSRLDEMMDG
jgi:hypothetical protein